MSLRIACPSCQTAYVVPSEKLGKRGRCPSCGHAFTLVDPDAANSRSAPPQEAKKPPAKIQRAEEEPVYVEAIADAPLPRRRAKGRKKKTGNNTFWWVLGAGIFLFSGLCAAGLVALVLSLVDVQKVQKLASSGDTPPKQLAPPQVMNANVANGSTLKETSSETTAQVVEKLKDATVFLKVRTGQSGVTGSGFVIRSDRNTAYVVTNEHVVHPKEQVLVQTPTPNLRIGPRGVGPAPRSRPARIVNVETKNAPVTAVFRSGSPREQELQAEVISSDAQADLALVKVVGVRDPPQPLEIQGALPVRETMAVWIYGFPFGGTLALGTKNPSVTVGKATISNVHKDNRGNLTGVQLDGSVNPGNSGGPIVDTEGRLIGVAVAAIRGSGIGLAIPGDRVPGLWSGVGKTDGTLPSGGQHPVAESARPNRAAEPDNADSLPRSDQRRVVDLPAPVLDAVTGGAGQYLILALPQARCVQIFDSKQAKVIRSLQVREGDFRIAAGKDKFFVAFPAAGILERYSLETFEKEVSVLVPPWTYLGLVAMGQASSGPLLIGGTFYDTAKMRPFEVQTSEPMFALSDNSCRVRVSADGKVMTVTCPPRVFSWSLNGSQMKWNTPQTHFSSIGYAIPSSDGQIIYSTMGLFNAEWQPIGPTRSEALFPLPAVTGPFYIAAPYRTGQPQPALYLTESDQPIASITRSVWSEAGSNWQREVRLAPDKRLFFFLEAKLLVTIPVAQENRLAVYPLDIDPILADSGLDYLFVTSSPPLQAMRGQDYVYALAVHSRKGNVRFRLESNPPGMQVSADGRISWHVPPEFAANEASVIVAFSDAGGQERFQSFNIEICRAGVP